MPIAPMLLEQHEVIITENSVDRRETNFLSSSQERMGMAVHRDTTSLTDVTCLGQEPKSKDNQNGLPLKRSISTCPD